MKTRVHRFSGQSVSLLRYSLNSSSIGSVRTTVAQGRVHTKTGTLRGVKALSGYIENPDYGQLVFSIVVNQPGQSAEVLSQAIDQIVLQSVRVNRCH